MLTAPQALLLALFGALGALSRYYLGSWVQLALGLGFPVGTLIINVAGSFALGLVYGWSAALGPTWRVALGVGFLGAFTTFSTFSADTVRLIQGEQPGLAMLNVAASVLLGLGAAWVGILLSR